MSEIPIDTGYYDRVKTQRYVDVPISAGNMGRPIVLVLAADRSVVWSILKDPGAEIVGVHIAANGDALITGLGDEVPVTHKRPDNRKFGLSDDCQPVEKDKLTTADDERFLWAQDRLSTFGRYGLRLGTGVVAVSALLNYAAVRVGSIQSTDT